MSKFLPFFLCAPLALSCVHRENETQDTRGGPQSPCTLDLDCQDGLVCDEASETCLGQTGAMCDGNDDCLGTCLASACGTEGGVGDGCDAGDDSDCEGALVCDASGQTCVKAVGAACGDNGECAQACIAGVCANTAGVGESCDASDSADCSAPLVCADGTCLRDDDQSCTANAECVAACIGGVCADRGSVGDACDGGDGDDCAAPLICDGATATCLKDMGQSCSGNDECTAVCVAGSCAASSELGGGCDSGEHADCSGALLCDDGSGTCLGDVGAVCASNDQCIATCIGALCSAAGSFGESCDGGDAQDCVAPLECSLSKDTCLNADGESCTSNADCAQTCIGGSCMAAAGVLETCDAGESADCQSGLVCDAGSATCLGDLGASCSANDECVATCVSGACSLPSDAGGTCDLDDDADCATGLACGGTICALADGEVCTMDSECAARACNHGSCGAPPGAVFIIEVEGHFGSNAAMLTEVTFLDSGDGVLSASATDLDAYDSNSGTVPSSWTHATNWCHLNLVDGQTSYLDSTEGRNNGTVFLTGSAAGPDEWARFALFVDDTSPVAKIQIHVGSPEDRIPYNVRVYSATVYDFDNQIAGRLDSGLNLLWTITPDATWTTVRMEEFVF